VRSNETTSAGVKFMKRQRLLRTEKSSRVRRSRRFSPKSGSISP
jgi:hypothetical protein